MRTLRLYRLVLLQQSFTDNPSRVVLAGVELLPIDIGEFGTDFVLELLARASRHPAKFLHEPAKLCGVLRQPLRPNHQYGNDRQSDELEPINSKHVERLPSTPLGLRFRTGRSPRLHGAPHLRSNASRSPRPQLDRDRYRPNAVSPCHRRSNTPDVSVSAGWAGWASCARSVATT